MKSWIIKNKYKIWYMICVIFLGIIDQRRGSAVGEVQMIFSNLTGIVVALFLLPSLTLNRFKNKVYAIWAPICIVLTIIMCLLGSYIWKYRGQWNTAVLNISVWSFLGIYITREWKNMNIFNKIKQPFWMSIFILLLLMILSVHEKQHTLMYFMIFGSFYLIGIPRERRDDFREGMLNGIIVWFFVQQTIAFGFRPYDYIRYRGLYSGETQNGIFYTIVFCAFIVKWLYAIKAHKKWWIRFFYFFMSAGCVGFSQEVALDC